MSDWQVGLSTGCFYKTPIQQCLLPIRDAGFNLIEICSFPAHLNYHDIPACEETAQILDDLGIEPYSFHAPFAPHIDITSPDENIRKISIDEILRAATAAATLDVRYFVLHPGPEEPPPSMEEERFARMQAATASLNTIAEFCETHHIQLLLENKLPHLVFGNISDMLWIISQIDSTQIGICLDTGHAALAQNLDISIQQLGSFLRMIHASDNHGEFDDHLPPGYGTLDWQHYLNLLSTHAFCGSIILEVAGQPDPQKLLHEAKNARKFLRNIGRHLRASSPPLYSAP